MLSLCIFEEKQNLNLKKNIKPKFYSKINAHQVVQNKGHRRIYEAIFFLLFGLGLFYLLSLITHSSSDDIWRSSDKVGTSVFNWGGSVGAELSEFSFFYLGLASYLIPLILLLVSIHSYQYFQKNKSVSYTRIVYRSVGFVLILAFSAGFMTHNIYALAGGSVGILVHQLLSGLFGHLVNIVYVSLVMIALSITGYLSWFVLFDKTGRMLLAVVANIKSYFEHKKFVREEKYQAKQLKKDRVDLIKANLKVKRDTPEILPKQSYISESMRAVVGSQKKIFDNKDNMLPSLSLLDSPPKQDGGYSKDTLDMMSKQVEAKLKDFGLEARIETVTPGPVITQFEISLAPGIKVGQVMSLNKDLARALLVESVRIIDVIVGKPVIGLEIPNFKREMISLKQILSSNEFEASRSPLSIALGKNINGQAVISDLAKMPHLLLAGATGMGKSVSLNAMILSILYKSSPKDVRFIMIDPKVVELTSYVDIPHLLTPVITDMNEAASALRWSVAEMERRYNLLAKLSVRNIMAANNKILNAIKNKKPLLDPFVNPSELAKGENPPEIEPLPLIVIIIDEYADMLGALAQDDRNKSKRVESLIVRLAQKARAAGIHLVIATQRPSVDVITGIIKSNIPTRIAFKVSSKIDSRTILDQSGAEQLLGMGDMLYMTTGQNVFKRIHGAFVSDDEVRRVTEALREDVTPKYVHDITSYSDKNNTGDNFDGYTPNAGGEKDPMYDEAVQIVLSTKRASISSLQRRLRIGYNRAARIIEDMEASGIVSSMNASGSRDILVPNHDEQN